MSPSFFSFYPSQEQSHSLPSPNPTFNSLQYSHSSPSPNHHTNATLASGHVNPPYRDMTVQEPAEFYSPRPLDSTLHTQSSPGHPYLSPSQNQNQWDWNTEHIPSLERDFCSDFTCCGRSLNDLHELVDHFEESHVLVIDSSGNPLYPAQQYSPSPVMDAPVPVPYNDTTFQDAGPHYQLYDHPEPGYPYASLVLGYPQPASECTSDSASSGSGSSLSPPIMVPSQADIRPGPIQSSISLPLLTEPSLRIRSHVPTANSSPASPSEPMCLPPSSFTTPQSSPSEFNVRSEPGYFRKITSSFSKKAERRQSHGHGNGSRKRDRVYKCPRQGCTKTYLNPNGLKYHLEKGTCKIEEPVFSHH